MKLTFLPFLVLICFCISCNSQNSDSFQSRLKNLHSAINNYNEKPIYYFHYQYSGCHVEIKLNGYTILNEYGYNTGEYYNDTPINQYLKENNTLTIKLTPLKTKLFTQQARLRIGVTFLKELDHYDSNLKKYDGLEAPFIFEFNTEDTIQGETFTKQVNLQTKSSFTKDFNFKAKLPFENIDFEKTSKDLRKLNPDILKQQILSYTKRFISSKDNSEDGDFFWKNMYYIAFEDCRANYKSKEDIDEYYNNIKTIFANNNFVFSDISSSKLTYYNNGRVAALVSDSNNFKIKDKPIIELGVKRNGVLTEHKSRNIQLYFHIPKDSNNLEIAY